MKFRVTMKDPDGVYDALVDAAATSAKRVADVDDDERQDIAEKRRERYAEFVGQWLRYGEYADIEFDTDAGTATLLKAK